jgi:twinkle protein
MQQGLPAVCSDSGSGNWLPEWFFRFIRCKETIVVFDNDDAGEKGSRNIAKALGEYRTKIYNSWEFDKGYSPAYFFRDGGTASQFKDLISEKAKYIFELGKKENGKFRKTWKNLEKY